MRSLKSTEKSMGGRARAAAAQSRGERASGASVWALGPLLDGRPVRRPQLEDSRQYACPGLR